MLPFGNIILLDHAARSVLEKKTIRVPFVPFTFIMTTPDGAWTYGSLFGRRWAPICGPERINDAAAINKGRYKLD